MCYSTSAKSYCFHAAICGTLFKRGLQPHPTDYLCLHCPDLYHPLPLPSAFHIGKWQIKDAHFVSTCTHGLGGRVHYHTCLIKEFLPTPQTTSPSFTELGTEPFRNRYFQPSICLFEHEKNTHALPHGGPNMSRRRTGITARIKQEYIRINICLILSRFVVVIKKIRFFAANKGRWSWLCVSPSTGIGLTLNHKR